MARYVFLFAFLLQATIIYAIGDDKHDIEVENELEIKTGDDDLKVPKIPDIDWSDILLLSKEGAGKLSEKPTEEELEEMKETAKLISEAIYNEMAYVISNLFKDPEEEENDSNTREKRSTDKSLDNSLIMKLLEHIKSNNQFQNIAIEKIMSAKQRAEDSGLDFVLDNDIFTELAIASSKQIEELSSILNNAYHSDNATTEIEFVPINNEPMENSENNTYYNYHIEHPEDEIEILSTPPSYEYSPDILHSENNPRKTSDNFIPIEPQTIRYHFHIPLDTQIPPPPYLPPVSPTPPPVIPPMNEHVSFSYMPDFFEQLLFSPSEFSHHIPMEPTTTIMTDFLFGDVMMPYENLVEVEPELIGEELEETVTSKLVVNKGDKPGTATVNHVMTYTVSEKSHFQKEPIMLPEQMQYYFLLI